MRNSVRGLAALTAVIGAGLVASPAALAGTISRDSEGDVVYVAPGGETNQVTISGSAASVTLTDAAGVSDGDGAEGCTVDGNTATCANVRSILTDLGDLNDTLTDTSNLPDNNPDVPFVTKQHNGDTGDDTLNGSPDRDFLSGDDGADTLNGGDLADLISGGAGNDTIDGQEGNDGFFFFSGLSGGAGNDTVRGGNGDDSLTGDEGDDTVDGGDGGDSVDGGANVDQVIGGPGEDSLYGGGTDLDPATSENDTLNGGLGDDELYGGEGDDALNGEAGNDYAYPGPDEDRGKDTYAGGDGRDTADYSDEDEGVTVTLDGQFGDGVSDVGEQDNVHADVEVVFGTSEDDTITGSAGPQDLFGNSGNDRLSGLDGDDFLSGAGDDDTLLGGGGNDRLDGGGESDSLNGEAGNDLLFESADGVPDDLEGGDGADTADLSNTGANLVVTLDGAANDGTGGGAEGNNVKTENVVTGFGSDFVAGSAGRNVIDTSGGNDTINAQGDDGAIDDVVCGTGFDTANVDRSDAPSTFGPDRCETVNGQAVASSPAAFRQPVAVPLTEKDPPRISVRLRKCSSKLSTFRSRGCLVEITTNEQARFHIALTARIRRGGARISQSTSSPLVLNDRDLGFTTGVRATVRPIVRPDRKLLRRTPRRFRVSFVIEAFDRAGNVTRRTVRKTIRR